MRRFDRPLWIYALGIGVALAIALFSMQLIWDLHQDTWVEARQNGDDLAASLTHDLRRNLELYELSLEAVADNLKQPGLPQMSPDVRDRFLFDRSMQADYFGPVLVIDRKGGVLINSQDRTPLETNYADQEFFKYHQAHPNAGLFISRPFRTDGSDELSIALSRGLASRGQPFSGVVVGTIDLTYFTNLFSSLALGARGGVTLLLSDGTILARFPYNHEDVGKTLGASPVFRKMVQMDSGSFVAVSSLDGVKRLFSFRRVGDFPLILVVNQSTDTLFAAWKRRAILMSGGTAILLGLCAILGYMLRSELARRAATEGALLEARNDLKGVLDNLPAMVGYWDSNLRNRFSNKPYLESFGKASDEIKGVHLSRLLGPELYQEHLPQIQEALDGKVQVFDRATVADDGKIHYTHTSYVPDIVDGQVRGFFVLVTDITSRHEAEMALFEEKERARVTLGSIGDSVVTTDVDGAVTYLNPIAEVMTGWDNSLAMGRPIDEVTRIVNVADGSPVQNPLMVALSEGRIVGLATDSVLISRQGVRYHIEDSAAPIRDRAGSIIGAVMVFHDVSETRTMALKMAHLAQHDALTDLPNRVLLHDRVSQAIERAKRTDRRVAVLFIDLDNFKVVNDSLGHSVGDKLLVQISDRLQSTVRKSDTVSRPGGDEFIVVLPDIEQAQDAASVAGQILECCGEPCDIDGRMIRTGCSVGISIFPEDGDTYEELMKNADMAMYRAKHLGRNRYVFFASWKDDRVG